MQLAQSNSCASCESGCNFATTTVGLYTFCIGYTQFLLAGYIETINFRFIRENKEMRFRQHIGLIITLIVFITFRTGMSITGIQGQYVL